MKAIVFAQTGGPEVLALAEVPRPDVRPGMVLVKAHAIGVNFADTRFRQGTYVAKPKLPDTRLHIGKTFALADAADAHRYLESRQSTGKLVLIP